MSEVRQDQATKRWVIVATDRAKRPRDLVAQQPPVEPQPAHSEKCPFCPGNESMTPPELYRIGEGAPGAPGWQVRVVPNRFAALSPEGEMAIRDSYWFTHLTGLVSPGCTTRNLLLASSFGTSTRRNCSCARAETLSSFPIESTRKA